MHNQEKFVLFLWLLLLVFAGQKYYLMYPYMVIHINLQKIVRRTFLPKLDHSLSYICINYSFHLQNELCGLSYQVNYRNIPINRLFRRSQFNLAIFIQDIVNCTKKSNVFFRRFIAINELRSRYSYIYLLLFYCISSGLCEIAITVDSC